MPSMSKAQHNAMEAAAHGHSTLGIPKSVGEEFSKADTGKTFKDAGPEQLIGMHGGEGYGIQPVYAPRQGVHRQAGLNGLDAIAKYNR